MKFSTKKFEFCCVLTRILGGGEGFNYIKNFQFSSKHITLLIKVAQKFLLYKIGYFKGGRRIATSFRAKKIFVNFIKMLFLGVILCEKRFRTFLDHENRYLTRKIAENYLSSIRLLLFHTFLIFLATSILSR